MIEHVAPEQVWAVLAETPRAVLCDVRTEPEWRFVGIPDLSPLGRATLLISWQIYPDMAIAADFCDQLRAAGCAPEAPLFFLCRSGVRSLAAASAAAESGFAFCFNVSDGFEGPLDGAHRRGRRGGWKAAGLPWRQT
jgi:rhodanese-related sulfurtransferase